MDSFDKDSIWFLSFFLLIVLVFTIAGYIANNKERPQFDSKPESYCFELYGNTPQQAIPGKCLKYFK